MSALANTGTLEGTLSKWTNVMKGWQYRFFVLDENAGLLSYYTSKDKMMKGVRRGCVRLKDAVIGIDDQEDNTFTITVDHKTFHFQAQHSDEREKWVRRLEDTIRRHANRSRLWDNQNTFYGSGYNKDFSSNKRLHPLELLARRVSEADAYLQLMIEQTNKIEKRIDECTDPEEREKCKVIHEKACAMLDHIKHSIVSVQIAKNMAHPINGIYNGPTTTTTSSATTAAGKTSTAEGETATIAETTTTGGDGDEQESDGIMAANLSNINTGKTNDNTGVIVDDDEDDSTTDNALLPTLDINSIATTTRTTPSEAIVTADIIDIDVITDGIPFGTDCHTDVDMNQMFEDSSVSSSSIADVTTAPLAMVVPETSYSSSEDDDDYYDAKDDPFTSSGGTPMSSATRGFSVDTSPTNETQSDTTGGMIRKPTPPMPVAELNEFPSVYSSAIKESNTPTVTTTSLLPATKNKELHLYDGTIDYDALYEEEEDTTISMEAHGSMISHLLSQVKIGMDLTKVVLPTFILERRSLLEMYADYFAHPDLFLKISDLESPRDRIVQVCRWYLSAYHAGRKSAVAKKPYNPILGEIFQCHWNIPGESHDIVEVKDGPVPWCRRDQLTFLAEQVSHHPPISAFYAEHYNKKITFTAHVWTKSKFLGLSIGVHNIGEGIVTLVDRSEEYIVTFPNGYGRSILTVPWIELGGSVEIRCAQTGYYANIEFLTKPFYGGKRNKVTAEIYAPNEKKPFVSIAGEWSGLMEAKWHDRNKTEVFVDVNRIPIFKKQVRPIVEQEDYESRRVWKEVTAGLKFNDIEKATNAKSDIEQYQRDQAKQRKDIDVQWEHKYFKKVGDNWIYTKPLSQRIYMLDKENKR